MQNIKLKGAKNTRDFGGIVNRDGKMLKAHCFLRSAALNKLSKKDIEILKNEYGLKTIIDLRTDEEIAEKPDVAIDGVKYIHIPVFTEQTAGITHEEGVDKREMLTHLPDLSNLYRVIVSNEDCVEQLRKIFEIIVSGENTILWHCTEGKDRCGIVSALFLSVIDVDIETIYQDYLLTNTARSKSGDKYYFLIRYLMRDKESAERIKRLFSAEKEYLDAAFDEIEKCYGGVNNFIRDKLRITEEMKRMMKDRFLE